MLLRVPRDARGGDVEGAVPGRGLVRPAERIQDPGGESTYAIPAGIARILPEVEVGWSGERREVVVELPEDGGLVRRRRICVTTIGPQRLVEIEGEFVAEHHEVGEEGALHLGRLGERLYGFAEPLMGHVWRLHELAPSVIAGTPAAPGAASVYSPDCGRRGSMRNVLVVRRAARRAPASR